MIRNGLVLVFLLTGIFIACSQKSDSCRVLIPEISGIYKGGCLNGLASGKGTAQGSDKYSGEFRNGKPEGKGTYTYANGNTFSGYWVNGLKNGKGKFIYSLNGQPTILSGYWKNDEYLGPKNPDETYQITNQTGIQHVTFNELKGEENKVLITFVSAMQSYFPTGLQVSNSTGTLSQQNKDVTIVDFSCPLTCEIHFIVPTSAGERECFLFFNILSPGTYSVTVEP